MIENVKKISSIRIESEAKCYCPLGQDWYTNHFTIDFEPDQYFPDYCQVDKWIDENINGKHMIIEDAVDMLHAYLKDTCMPYTCVVTSYVNDAKHSTVTVTKK